MASKQGSVGGGDEGDQPEPELVYQDSKMKQIRSPRIRTDEDGE